MSEDEVVEEPSDLVEVTVRPNPNAPAPVVHDLTLARARIGDVFRVSVDREVPAGWEVSDGRPRRTVEYPEFARALGVGRPTFTLPQVDQRPGIQTIVRVR